MIMDLKDYINNILYKDEIPKINVEFYKTEIISLVPYQTVLHDRYIIDKFNIDKIYREIISNELNIEYAICLNGAKPSYDDKKSGYRLTYSILNHLDSFSNRIFFMMKKICQLDSRPNITLGPTRIIFMLGIFLFLGFENDTIQNTMIEKLESIMIIRKERKTNIVFHIKECDDIDEMEKIIKRVFIFNPSSSFTKKMF